MININLLIVQKRIINLIHNVHQRKPPVLTIIGNKDVGQSDADVDSQLGNAGTQSSCQLTVFKYYCVQNVSLKTPFIYIFNMGDRDLCLGRPSARFYF